MAHLRGRIMHRSSRCDQSAMRAFGRRGDIMDLLRSDGAAERRIAGAAPAIGDGHGTPQLQRRHIIALYDTYTAIPLTFPLCHRWTRKIAMQVEPYLFFDGRCE